MARLIRAQECDCENCNGGTPAPPGNFGGSYCVCPCHKKMSDKERIEFLENLIQEMNPEMWPYTKASCERISQIRKKMRIYEKNVKKM